MGERVCCAWKPQSGIRLCTYLSSFKRLQCRQTAKRGEENKGPWGTRVSHAEGAEKPCKRERRLRGKNNIKTNRKEEKES